jgi:D-glycero-alpha-D-manno-heptose-7-phosphate kinase
MILTQTPFRITLGGGGTDLPSFYERHGGCVFAMTIDKHMYIMLHRLPVTERKTLIRYSQVEVVDQIEDIRHPLAREALRLHDVREYVEVSSIADLPAKTGLGSSGAYLVGLLTAIRALRGQPAEPARVAEEACRIEMDILKEPVGKQDQYMAAFGGFRVLNIAKDGAVTVESVPVDFMTSMELATKARMYYTGIQRSATAVLRDQDAAARRAAGADHERVVDSLCRIKEIGTAIRKAFADRDLDAFGRLMHEHWEVKKRMSARITLSRVDELYDEVRRRFGVLGGKIIGAGGGGFLMLYCPAKGRDLDAFMSENDMPRVSYFPAARGARVIADVAGLEERE